MNKKVFYIVIALVSGLGLVACSGPAVDEIASDSAANEDKNTRVFPVEAPSDGDAPALPREGDLLPNGPDANDTLPPPPDTDDTSDRRLAISVTELIEDSQELDLIYASEGSEIQGSRQDWYFIRYDELPTPGANAVSRGVLVDNDKLQIYRITDRYVDAGTFPHAGGVEDSPCDRFMKRLSHSETEVAFKDDNKNSEFDAGEEILGTLSYCHLKNGNVRRFAELEVSGDVFALLEHF